MASTMEAEAMTSTILDAFDLKGDEGDDLDGDVEEALDRVKQYLRSNKVSTQIDRMKVIRSGFDSWVSDLRTIRPNAEQLRQAMKSKAATAEALQMLGKIANQLALSSNVDIKNVEKHLSAMNLQVQKLTSMFPKARLQHIAETSQAPEWARFPLPDGEPFARVASSQPHDRYDEPQYTRISSFENRGPPRRQTMSSTFDPRSMPRRRIESIDANDNANFVAGEWIQTSPDAEGAARLGGIDVGPVRIGGSASGILGNVYGTRHPTDPRMSLPRHWSEM